MPSQSELRQQITQQIVSALSENQIPWRCPWRKSPNAGRPTSVATLRPYQGINPLLAQLHAHKFGFKSKFWGTFQQWEKWGCKVKRRPDGVEPGEWGCKIILYKPIQKKVTDEADGEDERDFFVMKTFCVFNAEQCEGQVIDNFLVTESQDDASTWSDFGPAEELIAATKAEIYHGGERAFYARPVPDDSFPNHRDGDYVWLPNKERFESMAAYYETAMHELSHWAEPRLGWDWKNETYAMGELVAELASCMVAQELGVPNSGELTNHASYLQSWIKAMNGDSRFIFKASTQASKVTDFLLSFVQTNQPQPEQAEVV